MSSETFDQLSLPTLPPWFVIQTKPGEEARAEANLSAWGLETFAPRWRERRVNSFTGKPTFFPRPLFPRYIFARFDLEQSWNKVSYTRGVQKVLSFGLGPVPVSDQTIEKLRARMDGDGYVRVDEDFEPGERVRIKHGIWRGVDGVFDSRLTDSERVKILLTSINYRASITVGSEMVERAAAAAL